MMPTSSQESHKASVPFRKFHGNAFRPGKKDQLSVMEVHDLVAELDALRFKPCHLGFQVVYGEADMVEPQFGEVVYSRIREWTRVAILQ